MNLKSKIKKWKISKFLVNKRYYFDRSKILNYLPKRIIDKANNRIKNWKNYKKTPLIKLNKLSRKLRIGEIFYKDESKRFHLKSFKALGGAYAVEVIANRNKRIIVSSATAGNHGRSVAWGAQRLGIKCKIFVSQNVSKERVESIKKFGAEVFRVKGNYEKSLNECKVQSRKNKWKIIQDVSTNKYKYIPQLTMAGYSIMIRETSVQTNKYITHIFLQAGVGGMAAGVVAGVARYFKRIPKIIIIEPYNADCVLKSIYKGKMTKIKIKKESIMGGMSCNEMSLLPWKILKNASEFCLSVKDEKVPDAIAMLAKKKLSDKKIIGGECAAPGIISMISVCNNQEIKKKLGLNHKSNVLLIGCEGNVDNILYKKLIKKGSRNLKI